MTVNLPGKQSQANSSDLCSLQCECRAFAVMADQAAGDTQSKMKRLSREMRNLRGKTALPVHTASAIFVRHDADRIDKVRAMITGAALPLNTAMHGGPSLTQWLLWKRLSMSIRAVLGLHVPIVQLEKALHEDQGSFGLAHALNAA